MSNIKEILQFWDIDLKKEHENIPIVGSPDRTDYRVVIEDVNEDKYVLENIPTRSIKHKEFIANLLSLLEEKGMQGVEPYIKIKGNFFNEYNGEYWQLIRFVESVELNRPDYIFEMWRAKPIIDFMRELQFFSDGVEKIFNTNVFDIKTYVDKLMISIKAYKPQISEKVQKVYDHLQKNFFKAHNEMPIRFCHGDFHCMNILWDKNAIKKVIDWEFCGYKPETYDLVNMIGCLGIEDPNALKGPLVLELIKRAKDKPLFADISWDLIVDYIVAVRFAWLSEWLRKKDDEMLELELDYMELLVENVDNIKSIWGIK